MKRIYLDWAATANADFDILKNTVVESKKYFANPSSPHKQGKDARNYISQCKLKLSRLWGADANNLFFTSGGTESNNIIISSLLNKKRIGNIVISAIEHSSVYEEVKYLQNFGWEVREIKPDRNGQIPVTDFLSAIDKETRLASIMMINNETGAIQPVEEIGKLLKNHKYKNKVHFHVDAVQSACKYGLSLSNIGADSASISSHKFQGPRGVGVLYLKKEIETVFHGGGQERNIRSGTENIFGIAGTLLAAEKQLRNAEKKLEHSLNLKKVLISKLSKIDKLSFNPDISTEKLLDTNLFSPYIISANIKPIPGEIIVRVMSDRGFDISTGSACSAGKNAKNRVLEAFGLSKEASYSSIRISTGFDTKIEDIEAFCDTLKEEVDILARTL